MSREIRSHAGRARPAGSDGPCIWMSVGLLAYRLCDRDFDCESCPLDAALRGVELRKEEHPEPAPVGEHGWEFRDDRRYHRSHGWVLGLSGGTVRWGVDAFAAGLLDHVGVVVLPAVESRLREGRVACWLGDGELVPLRAPVSGTVVRINDAARMDPALIHLSPYDDGWLAELDLQDPGRQAGLLSAEEARARTSEQVEDLRRRVARQARGAEPGVGPTLADGGEPLSSLRAILGPKRYRRWLVSLLP